MHSTLKSIVLTLLLGLLLVIIIAYWYAAIAVAAVTLLYGTSVLITKLKSNLRS